MHPGLIHPALTVAALHHHTGLQLYRHAGLLAGVEPLRRMLARVPVPGKSGIQKTVLWQRLRHRVACALDTRVNSTFTGFVRLPTQFDALAGPVVAAVRPRSDRTPLRVTLFGFSNGAAPVSIVSTLMARHPDLDVRVQAYDIEPACLRKAVSRRYGADEIFNNSLLSSEFVRFTFDRDGGSYVVKPEIAERITYRIGDILDRELIASLDPSDIVLVQNVLFHMAAPQALRALGNVYALTRPGSALFIDGVDLNVRQQFVRRKKLIPLDYRIEQIHDEARRARAPGWPYHYWGLEPLMPNGRHWRARYATIFFVR